MKFGANTRQERLHIVAANLHLVYSEGPLTKSDAFAAQVRLLHTSECEESRTPLPSVRQMCAGIKPDHEIEHIVVCPVCGQMFDCRDGPQLDHHSSGDHAPKLAPRSRGSLH